MTGGVTVNHSTGLLLTDAYELRMAASYLRRGMSGVATFSLFVRRLPPSRGFLVAAGLEACVAFLDTFGAGDGDEGYLTEIAGLTKADARALAEVRFTGDVWALPEGTVVFENEPLIEVTAPIAEAQLVETFLLNQITFQTAIASKAARCRIAAGGRPLVEFGFRRTHGVEAGMAAARASAIAGFAATSNVAAAQRYSLAISGTMAHSYVEAFDSEAAALGAFAEDFPLDPTFLIDTYDPLSGVESAILAARAHRVGDHFSVRLDSGDLDAVTRAIRKQLDDAGYPHARIFVSGGLDEYDIDRLLRSGAPIDAFGIGTKLGVSADAPTLDSAYKLVMYDSRPLMKLSPGKSNLPAAKQVFRNLEIGGDIVGLRDERLADRRPLLEPVMRAGRRLAPPETIEAMATRLTRELSALPGSALRIEHPEPPLVMVSAHLKQLHKECVAKLVGAHSVPATHPPAGRSGETSPFSWSFASGGGRREAGR
jgi:nicotinate phosphoribosyltransferase